MRTRRNTATYLIFLILLLAALIIYEWVIAPTQTGAPAPNPGSPTTTLAPPAPTLATELETLKAGPRLTVRYLDVGQGDATLIRSPGGKTMLIDGGKTATIAESVILPALRAWNAKQLDYMVLTHPDQDHIGGLQRVVETMPVGQVMLTGQLHTTVTYERLLAAISNKKLKAIKARSGTSFNFDPALTTVILAPNDAAVKGSDTNNASIVMRMTFDKVSFLFIGDAEGPELTTILNSHAEVRAQVLKVGHHGSSTSTNRAWLQAVRPEVGIISVGENSYGHPHRETLELLADFGIRVYRTDQHGTITVESDGAKYRISTER